MSWLIRGYDKGLPKYYTAKGRLVKAPKDAIQFLTYNEALAWAQEIPMSEWMERSVAVVRADATGLLRKHRLR